MRKPGWRAWMKMTKSSVMAPLIYGKACMLVGDLGQAKKLLDQCAILVEKTKGPFMKMIINHHRSELAFFLGTFREAGNRS